MRWLLFVLLLARPSLADQIVVLHESELLGSESKALAEMAKKLKVPLHDASADEIAATRGGPLPASWSGNVVVLEVLPPGGVKPKRISRGLGSIWMFRPPGKQPVYVERIDGSADAELRGLGEFITRLWGLR